MHKFPSRLRRRVLLQIFFLSLIALVVFVAEKQDVSPRKGFHTSRYLADSGSSSSNLAFGLRYLGAGATLSGSGYILSPDPNGHYCPAYSGLCSGSGLTDGVFSTVSATSHPDWAGWLDVPNMVLTFDLGSNQPIDEVRIHSVINLGDTAPNWPSSIFMTVSEDNVTYHYVTDLVEGISTPTDGVERPYTFSGSQLNTHGRYVKFIVSTPYRLTFFSEVEILRGTDASVAYTDTSPLPADLPSMSAFIHWKGQMMQDIAQLRLRATATDANIEADLSSLETRVRTFQDPAGEFSHFKTVFPRDPIGSGDSTGKIQHDLLALAGQVLRAEGWSDLVAWKPVNRWDPQDVWTSPETGSSLSSLDLHLMNGEKRLRLSEPVLLCPLRPLGIMMKQ